MSRIREALKKAEEERGTAPGAELAPAAGGAGPAPVEKEHSFGEAIPQGASAHGAHAEWLRFDDLLSKCVRTKWHLDPGANVFANADLSPQGAEQFRTLRSRLYQLRKAQNLRTVLVTSSLSAEGKTFVSSNIAQAIVRQPDRRVLLIDADLRKPRLHVPFGAPQVPGLADYLKGEVDEMQVIQHGQEGNLCLIAGGPEASNPSELLSNGRLKNLLDRVTPVFDWVIIDSPPCVPVADATILADYCDAVLLVVRAGKTPTEVAQRALQELQDRNVAGVVLNYLEKRDLHGSYYSYYSRDAYVTKESH